MHLYNNLKCLCGQDCMETAKCRAIKLDIGLPWDTLLKISKPNF